MQTTWVVLRGRAVEAGPWDTRGEAVAWAQAYGSADVQWGKRLLVRPQPSNVKERRGMEEDAHAAS
jgi:hypothetical protein